eukprot:SAG25_NODE_320_length_9927_cov_18.459402_6_plen_95_part_00
MRALTLRMHTTPTTVTTRGFLNPSRVNAAHAPYTGAAAGVALALRAQPSWLPPSDEGGDGRAVLVLCVWHLFGPARYYLRGHCFPGRIRVGVFV